MRHGRFLALIALVVVVVLGGTRPLIAQTVGSTLPPAGTRVRVTLESPLSAYRGGVEPRPESLIGTLVAVDAGMEGAVDTRRIVVVRAGGAEAVFPMARVPRLEVSHQGWCSGISRRTQCAILGAAGGAAVGLLLATTVWANTYDKDVCQIFPEGARCEPAFERRRRLRHAAFGTAVGLSLGLSVRRERWIRVMPWPPSQAQ